MESELLTARDAARYLGLTEGWLAKLRVFGNGPAFCRMGGRRIRYRRADLDDWVAANRHSSTSEYSRRHRP